MKPEAHERYLERLNVRRLRLAINICLLAIVLLISTSVSPTWATPRPHVPTWARTYGGTRDAFASSVQQTPDGGFIVAGSIGFSSHGIWVLRLDSEGSVVWQNTYGGTGASSVQQTSDGGFIVAGSIFSLGNSISSPSVLRLNSSGDVVWQKNYGGTGYDFAHSVKQTSDGGFIVAGDTNAFGAGGSDAWLLRLDSAGSVVWQKTYGTTGDDVANFVQQTSDGGFIVAGGSNGPGGSGGSGFAWVFRLDPAGSVIWQKTYAQPGFNDANSVQQTSDGGFIVAGHTSSMVAVGFFIVHAWVFRLDSTGDVVWQKIYGGTGTGIDDASSVQQTSDGGFIVAGGTSSFGAGGNDAWVFRLDSTGDVVWQKTYGGPGDDGASSVQQTSDGGFVVAGGTSSFGAGGFDAWVLRLDSSGNIGHSDGCTDVSGLSSAIVATTTATVLNSAAIVTSPAATVTSTSVTGTPTSASVSVQCRHP